MMAATLTKVMPANSSTPEGGRPASLPDQRHSQSEGAAALHVSERSVRDAAKVQRDGTAALNQAVVDGTLSVSDAAKVAAESPGVQDQAVKAVQAGEASTVAEAVRTGEPGERAGE